MFPLLGCFVQVMKIAFLFCMGSIVLGCFLDKASCLQKLYFDHNTWGFHEMSMEQRGPKKYTGIVHRQSQKQYVVTLVNLSCVSF